MLPANPTLAKFLEEADRLAKEGVARFRTYLSLASGAAAALEESRVTWLGDKQGELKKLQLALSTLPQDERREAGRAFNDAKAQLTAAYEESLQAQNTLREAKPNIDLTMPARERWRGGKHPVTLVIDEIVAIFRELGFTVALGPESESEWYNFG
ncbi:MAG: hypothetical protein ABI664_21165, partial [bacterium]